MSHRGWLQLKQITYKLRKSYWQSFDVMRSLGNIFSPAVFQGLHWSYTAHPKTIVVADALSRNPVIKDQTTSESDICEYVYSVRLSRPISNPKLEGIRLTVMEDHELRRVAEYTISGWLHNKMEALSNCINIASTQWMQCCRRVGASSFAYCNANNHEIKNDESNTRETILSYQISPACKTRSLVARLESWDF